MLKNCNLLKIAESQTCFIFSVKEIKRNWEKKKHEVKTSRHIYIDRLSLLRFVEDDSQEEFTDFDNYNYVRLFRPRAGSSADTAKKIYCKIVAGSEGSKETLFCSMELDQEKLFQALRELNITEDAKRYLYDIQYETKPAKLIIDADKTIQEVLNNSIVRKKFRKAIMDLVDSQHTEIRIYNDYVKYSFGFSKYINGVFNYNGGLIFHQYNSEPLSKCKYSIHT